MSPQKKATIIASTVAIILTMVKFAIVIISGSVVVFASAVDSLLDTVISIFNFFAIKKSEEKVSRSFQFGKGKIQAIAAVIEGTIIIISGLYIIYEATKKIINKDEITLVYSSIMAMTFSMTITFLLVKYLQRVAKNTNNLVIKSDALHYRADLLSNGVILISLILIYFTKLNIIDAIFGIGIGIYIIYSAHKIIKEGIYILLDHALDNEIVLKIEKIIDSHSQVNSYHWLKTRTDGNNNFVEFHLVLEPKMLLEKAHQISDELEKKIAELDSKRIWIITPHYDPYDDENINNAIREGIFVKNTK